MHIDIKIKSFDELTKDELYALLKLRQEVFVVEQSCPYLDSDGKDQIAHHVILYDGEGISAYARILPPGYQYKNCSAIGRVLVAFPSRGKKLGNVIMEASIKYALDHWPNPIKLSAQSYTLDFYQKLGFCAVGEEYLEDDIPHQAMILRNKD